MMPEQNKQAGNNYQGDCNRNSRKPPELISWIHQLSFSNFLTCFIICALEKGFVI